MQNKELDEINAKLSGATPQEILSWAIRRFWPRVGLSSSFGGESAALIHMAIQIEPRIPILFVDTGFLFKETLQFKEDLRKRFNLTIREFPATPEQIEITRKNLVRRQKTGFLECCDASKIACLSRSLEGLECWIAGLRRNQSDSRKNIKTVEEYRTGLVKVHPMASWTSKDIYQYMTANSLPFHPLWEKGYKSIGCEPCTTLPTAGAGERSGRWAGLDKTECGIHTFMEKRG